MLPTVGLVVLWSIYRKIQTDWPEAYTSVLSTFEERIRRNPIRSYILFRTCPVVLVTLFVAVMLERFHAHVWLGSLILILGHLFLTNGRASFEVLKSPRHPQWVVLILYHGISTFIILFTGLFTVKGRSLLKGLVPPTDQLLIAIWSGLFAAVIITSAKVLITAEKLSEEQDVEQLIQDIGCDVWNYIEVEAGDDKVLLCMLQSTVLEEVRQRPRWFRKLERKKGKLFKKGTYGVAQIAAPQPISDTESIAILAKNFRAQKYPGRDEICYSKSIWFNKILEDVHSQDPEHRRRIIEMFFYCWDRNLTCKKIS